MNDIKTYNAENIGRLKLWLGNMAAQGHTKFYEILVDGRRVVYKTDNPEEFDNYFQWIDEQTQSMRVLVYNTRNSHRSQVFEFRTENYVDGVSEQLYPTRKRRQSEDEIEQRVQQALEDREKELANEELKTKANELSARLKQAESYIRELEEKFEMDKASKSSFDVNSLLGVLSGFAAISPQAGDNLQGLKTILTPGQEPENQNTSPDSFIRISRLTLDNEQCSKVSELAEFLVKNPHYIDTVHSMFKSEASKAA